MSELVKRRCSCRHHASGSEDCLACCVGVAQAQRDRAEAELTEARAALDDVAAALGFDGEELPPGRVAAGLLSRIRGDEEAAAKRMIENGRLRAALEAPTPAAYQRDLEQEVARLRSALEAERERQVRAVELLDEAKKELAALQDSVRSHACVARIFAHVVYLGNGGKVRIKRFVGSESAKVELEVVPQLRFNSAVLAGCEEALKDQTSSAATHRGTEAAHEERRESALGHVAPADAPLDSVAGASPEAGRAICYADFGFEGMLMERAASVASPAVEPPASAGESFGFWHARETNQGPFCYHIRWEARHAIPAQRFIGRTCLEVYAAEHPPAAEPAGYDARCGLVVGPHVRCDLDAGHDGACRPAAPSPVARALAEAREAYKVALREGLTETLNALGATLNALEALAGERK